MEPRTDRSPDLSPDPPPPGGSAAGLGRESEGAPPADRGPGPDRSPEPGFLVGTPSQNLLVVAVVIGFLVVGGLAWWVTFIPYSSGGPTPISCGADLVLPPGPDSEVMLQHYQEGCDAARAHRRNVAIVLGAVVVVGLAAASTWPSRRLTRSGVPGPDGRGGDGPGEGTEAEDDASELRRLGLLDDDGGTAGAGPGSAAAAGTTGGAGGGAVPDDPYGDEVSELRRLGLLGEISPDRPGGVLEAGAGPAPEGDGEPG